MLHTLARRSAALVAAASLVVLGACSGAQDEPEREEEAEVEFVEDAGISARVLPRLSAPGEDTQDADEAEFVVEVRLTGPGKKKLRAGRVVELESADSREWSVVDTATTDKSGRAVLTSAEGERLRVVSTRTDEVITGRVVRTDEAVEPTLTDEFDEFNEDLWQTRAQGYAGVRMCSKATDDGAVVEDGVIRLGVIDDPDRGDCRVKGKKHAYRLNGHIGTQGAFEFRYGYAAARIKFQPGRGQHGAFWMQTPYGHGPADTHGAEIDVVEYFGDGQKNGGLTSFAYWYPDGEIRKTGDWIVDPERFGGDWSEKYHVFSVEWTPKEYIFRIDGQVTFRTKKGVSQMPQFLVLSLLSSDYELKHIDDDDLPQHMDVDWVRVWNTDIKQGTWADHLHGLELEAEAEDRAESDEDED